MLEAQIIQNPWQPVTQQYVFRQLMNAFAYPGRPHFIAPLSDVLGFEGGSALTHVLATLLDMEVDLADCDGLVAPEDWPRLEVRRGEASSARFVLGLAERAPTFEPALGSLENPDEGATIILLTHRLGEGACFTLAGPGIQENATLSVTGLHPDWLTARAAWNASFPMGVDLLLVDQTQAVALPRTTHILIEEKD